MKFRQLIAISALNLAFFATKEALADMPVTTAQAEKVTAPEYSPGTIRHFVAFKFKDATTSKQIEEVSKRFLALKNLCLRNGKPYIQSIEMGRASSFEGADQGMQIGFIVTFGSEGDRNFYVGQPLISEADTAFFDQAHLDFKKFVGRLLNEPAVPEGVFVFDFKASE